MPAAGFAAAAIMGQWVGGADACRLTQVGRDRLWKRQTLNPDVFGS